MIFEQPVTELMRRRYSCRSYQDAPIAADVRQSLADFAASLSVGPLGTQLRFELIAATEEDRRALKDLGTYGFIKGATGFLVGAMAEAEYNLEDYGYLMEC
ncbi:MAG: nitroreductase family protein, partial [Anaerolineae bacterium]